MNVLCVQASTQPSAGPLRGVFNRAEPVPLSPLCRFKECFTAMAGEVMADALADAMKQAARAVAAEVAQRPTPPPLLICCSPLSLR